MALITLLVAAPVLAYAQGAQASITGVVKDTSGAVLPGVTVEASSPALTGSVRSATTDGSGLYRIVDLLPGTYSVTFTLQGFSVVKREGVVLSGAFTATVNAEMRVGQLQETVTVTGETPIVDVQSVRRQTTITSETLTSIPTARSWAATAMLIPGIVTQAGSAADVQVTPQMTVFGGMGGRANEGRMEVDGLGTGAALNGGGVSTYVADISNASEVTTTTSGGLGEAETGGPTLSIIPKSGGNTVSGAVYLTGTGAGMIRSNYDDALKSRGLATPGKLTKEWDFTGGVGGPIIKDRFWFYATGRNEGEYRSIPGIFPNKNAGDPTQFLYVPDTTKVAQGAESFKTFSGRLTLQANAKNRVNLQWEQQYPCNGSAFGTDSSACRDQHLSGVQIGSLGLGGLTATTSPETAGYLPGTLVRNRQLTWTSTATNKLLLEAGLGSYNSRWGPFESPGNPTRGMARVLELTGVGNGGIPLLSYRSANWSNNWDSPTRWRAAASYVTGAHSFKVGYMGSYMMENITNFTNDLNLSYTFLNGRPVSLTESLNPYTQKNRVETTAIYGQDQWTLGRLTLQGALRYDRAWSWSPPQTIGPSNYLTSQVSFPRTPGVDAYKDLSPRGGAAWDVFGNGKTSVKVNFGKYLDPASNLNDNYSISNPIQRIATTSSRTWLDPNGDYIPQCDLANPAANGECFAMNSPTFGTSQYITGSIDPAILNGWSVRPGDWEIGASVQHQVLPRMSVEVGYFRRWLTNFTATDNRAVSSSDFTSFSIAAPTDSRLPNGGGYTVSGLYDVVPTKFGQTDNNVTFAKNLGGWTQVYNGILLNVSARASRGLTFQAGINSGKTVQNICGVRDQLPELTLGFGGSTLGPTNPYCNIDPGFITKVTGLATYTVPKIDVLVSGTIRSDQGAPLRATWNAPSATVINPALGRTVSSRASTVAVDLVAPGQVWGDRVNEIDMRFAKIVRFARTRSTIGLDIYNLVNSNAVLTYNTTFNPAVLTGPGSWLQPLSVLTPRFFKVSAQIDF
ncbi:MAG TPA: carboxypeptidase regulatory-like domain-containing protein [Vicinamibacterales bacterium]|nr:carboxypeptidase regulatory-like domain-containing protein [Vicinamibacterales bacterium]